MDMDTKADSNIATLPGHYVLVCSYRLQNPAKASSSCVHTRRDAPSSVSSTWTVKKLRVLKLRGLSPAQSAEAQPAAFRRAKRLPLPSCLLPQHRLHTNVFEMPSARHCKHVA